MPPPIIESFTVNGETELVEQTRAGRFRLAAQVTDDHQVARVEFWQNGAMVATDSAEPFEHSVVLASQHNGSQSFYAIAYDSSDQSAQSDEISLSLNISGGSQLILREDLGLVQFGLQTFVGRSLPKIENGVSDDVIVTATARSSMGETYNRGLAFRRLTLDLSVLNTDEFYGTYDYFSDPVALGDDEDTVVIAGSQVSGDDLTQTLFSLPNYGDQLTLTSYDTGAPWEFPDNRALFAIAANGDTFVQRGEHEISRYDPSLSKLQWSHSIPTATLRALQSLSDDGLALVFESSDCTPGNNGCIRKLSAAGESSWTRGLQTSFWADGSFPIPQETSADTVLSVAGSGNPLDTDGRFFALFSPTGEELPIIDLSEDWPVGRIQSFAISPTGAIVAVGHSGGYGAPHTTWMACIDQSGELVWEEYLNLSPGDEFIGDVTITDDGRLYITGVSNFFDPALFTEGAGATLWVAEYAL